MGVAHTVGLTKIPHLHGGCNLKTDTNLNVHVQMPKNISGNILYYLEAAQLALVEPKKNWQELALLIGGACTDTWIRDIVDDDHWRARE